MNSCCYPATNALQITLHKHLGCILSLAPKTGTQTGSSTPDWLQHPRLAQAPDWPQHPGLAQAPEWPQHPRLALAPQTGPGTSDWPWHPRLALAHPDWPSHPRLALAPQTGPGTPDCEEILRFGRLGKSEALRKFKVDYLLETMHEESMLVER